MDDIQCQSVILESGRSFDRPFVPSCLEISIATSRLKIMEMLRGDVIGVSRPLMTFMGTTTTFGGEIAKPANQVSQIWEHIYCLFGGATNCTGL